MFVIQFCGLIFCPWNILEHQACTFLEGVRTFPEGATKNILELLERSSTFLHFPSRYSYVPFVPFLTEVRLAVNYRVQSVLSVLCHYPQ